MRIVWFYKATFDWRWSYSLMVIEPIRILEIFQRTAMLLKISSVILINVWFETNPKTQIGMMSTSCQPYITTKDDKVIIRRNSLNIVLKVLEGATLNCNKKTFLLTWWCANKLWSKAERYVTCQEPTTRPFTTWPYARLKLVGITFQRSYEKIIITFLIKSCS